MNCFNNVLNLDLKIGSCRLSKKSIDQATTIKERMSTQRHTRKVMEGQTLRPRAHQDVLCFTCTKLGFDWKGKVTIGSNIKEYQIGKLLI